MATILWCLNHDWPKHMKIQYRIRSPNLVLLLSTSPNLHTGRDIQSRHIFDKMVDRDAVSCVGKSGFASHTKHRAEATITDLLHS